MAVYLGVDFGARAVRIFHCDKGIVLREPNVAAVDTKGNVIAVGTEALLISARAPGTVTVRRPVSGGSITDFNLAAEILDRFLEIAAPRAKKHIIAAARYGLGTAYRELLRKALSDCRTGHITIVDSAPASLLGSGFTPAPDEKEALSGTVICDIGAGSVETSYIRAGELMRTKTLIGAGDAADNSIMTYLKRHCGVAVTKDSAREAKHRLSLLEASEPVLFAGIDGSTGMPKRVSVPSEILLRCCDPQIAGVTDTISSLIENLPHHGEASSSFDRVILVGGGAMLHGIGEYVERTLGIAITAADLPTDCTVAGLGVMISKM